MARRDQAPAEHLKSPRRAEGHSGDRGLVELIGLGLAAVVLASIARQDRTDERRGFDWKALGSGVLSTLQALGIAIAGVGLILTARQLENGRKAEAATLGLQFDDRLSKPEIQAILDAVEDQPPRMVLKQDGGASGEDQLEDLLGDYETLYYLHEDDLIDDRIVYNLFCYDLEAVHSNAEIERYLAVERKLTHAPNSFVGFDKIAAICGGWDKVGEGRRLAS